MIGQFLSNKNENAKCQNLKKNDPNKAASACGSVQSIMATCSDCSTSAAAACDVCEHS